MWNVFLSFQTSTSVIIRSRVPSAAALTMGGRSKNRNNQREEETTNEEPSTTEDSSSKKMNEMRKKLDPIRGEQYRETTLGRALSISLSSMIESGKMPQSLASKILMHFDVHMEAHLKKCSTRVIFKTDRMTHYKEYKSNYFLYFENVELTGRGRLGNYHVNVDKMQVTAVPSKALLLQQLKKKQNKMNKGNEKGNQTSAAAVVTQNSD